MRYRFIGVMALACLGGCAVFSRDVPSVYVVYFPKGSTELATDAKKIVDQAAVDIKHTHPAAVTIGAGVSSGSDPHLSQPRFAAVRDALVADGVDTALIARSSIADDGMDAGVVGDQRVEIRLTAKATP
ncbi:MAG: hypothetical protein WDN01_15780 [Rhizomicrobium sp.]